MRFLVLLKIENLGRAQISFVLCLWPVAGGWWPFPALCDSESDLRIFRYDAYMPWLAVFFWLLKTTERESTDVLSSDQEKFMPITE